MKSVSLKAIYLVALSAVFAVSFLMFTLFEVQSQKEQSEAIMLEEARTFAREMDAVWKFMDLSQERINTTSDGTFEFKGLHCSIVGKSVGALFSAGNDYAIRYTNVNPRSVQGKPDEFEAAALALFNSDASSKEYYGIAEFDGTERFRYVRALEVNRGCLDCHGEPAGELDITGKVKEGWTLESVGGAISIVIPLDQQQQAAERNIISDLAYFFLITVIIGVVILAVTTFFVFRPLGRMKEAFALMEEGRLSVSLKEEHAAKEIARLIVQFNSMTSELHAVYEHLEEQVQNRTDDLQQANATLEHQRDTLEHLNEKLAKEGRFKSDLLSMVNHELRTPLTSIITFAQISRESCEPHDQHSWEEIEKNSQILLSMINNMLDIARSDAGGIRATCEPMDLGDIVALVRTTMLPLAQKYLVTFTSKVAPDVPLAMGDYEKTQRMLENLSSNAIKFTPDGGHIELCVVFDRDKRVVTLRVIDDGIGIAQGDQERIFERFVQVDSTSTRKYNGSGLGLALVKDYAAIQGFMLSVHSKLECGSTFTIEIPSDKLVIEDE